jgi:peptidoglycan L-alanyl-D-glutamate endopeptidase CwlK
MGKLSQRSKDNLLGVHPNLVKVIELAVIDSPIDFMVIEGVRETKRQQDLFAQGRTKPGKIVTYADGVKNKSNHQPKADNYGHAIDFVPIINGKVDWNNHNNFKIIADHIVATGKKIGIKIVAGFYWKKPYDPPHLQLG